MKYQRMFVLCTAFFIVLCFVVLYKVEAQGCVDTNPHDNRFCYQESEEGLSEDDEFRYEPGTELFSVSNSSPEYVPLPASTPPEDQDFIVPQPNRGTVIKIGIPTAYDSDCLFVKVLKQRGLPYPEGCGQHNQAPLSLHSSGICYVALDTYKVLPHVIPERFLKTTIQMIIHEKYAYDGSRIVLNPAQIVDCLIVDVRAKAHSQSDHRLVIDMNPGNQLGGGVCEHLGLCWTGDYYVSRRDFASFVSNSAEFVPYALGNLNVEFRYDLDQLN